MLVTAVNKLRYHVKNPSTFACMVKRGTGILIVVLLGLCLVILNRHPLQLRGQHHFVLHRVSASGYEIRSITTIYNPNFLSSTIHSLREEFRLNGQLVSVVKQQPMLGIPGRKEISFPLSVRLDEETFARAAAADSMVNGSLMNLTVRGEITYTNFTGGGNMVVNFDQPIKLD